MDNFSKSDDNFFNNQALLVSSQAIILLVGLIIENILRYGYSILLGRTLGAEILGRYFLGLTIVTFIAAIGCFGLDGGIIRYIPQYLGRNQINKVNTILRNSLQLGLFIGLALTGLILLLNILNILPRAPLFKDVGIFYVSIPFLIIFSLVIAFFQGYKQLNYQVYIQNIFRPITNILFFIVLFYMGYKLEAATWSFIIAVILSNLIAVYFLEKKFEVFSSELDQCYNKKDFLQQSFWIWVILIASLSMRWSDTLIISYFRTYKEVGIYGAAIRASCIFDFFSTPLRIIFGPVVASLYYLGKNTEINRLLKTVTRWNFSVILPLFLLFALNAKIVMGFFGKEFIGGGLVFIILSGIFLFSPLTSVFSLFLLTMTGRVRLFAFDFIFCAALNIVLNLIFIPKYGILTAAVISLVSYILLGIITMLQVYHIHKMHHFAFGLLRPLFSLLLASLAVFVIYKIIPDINIVFNSIIFLLVYAATLGFRKEDKLVFNFLKQRLFCPNNKESIFKGITKNHKA